MTKKELKQRATAIDMWLDFNVHNPNYHKVKSYLKKLQILIYRTPSKTA